MFTLWGARQKFCDGVTRRNFLQIGALGAGLTLADLLRLRAEGAEVAVFDRDVVDGYLSLTGDVASSADVDAAVAKIEAELGRIDILVNSAGVPGASLRTVDVTEDLHASAEMRRDILRNLAPIVVEEARRCAA